ncbi:hypothetical protein N9R86_01755 [Alphaproteobacteria bacterium]|nr:hypothetical protein [Alphaproteobacteria bacterium]
MTYKLFTILLFLIIIIISTLWYNSSKKYNNEVIKVNIKLVNNCELYDKAFMVKAFPSNKTTRFKDKKAMMFLTRSSKIKLEASDEFPGFHFSSLAVKVDNQVDLIADCSNSDRLDNIFDSLKDQFNKETN